MAAALRVPERDTSGSLRQRYVAGGRDGGVARTRRIGAVGNGLRQEFGMETGKGNTGVKREARRQSLRVAKLSESQLTALEKSKPTDMTLRLIRELREARRERDEAVGGLAIERAELQREAEEASKALEQLKSFDRERAIVVIYPDGFVEVYGSKYGLDVHIVEVSPMEDEGAWVARLPAVYKELAMPGKIKGYGQLTVRPELSDTALVNLLLYEQRREFIEKMNEISVLKSKATSKEGERA